MIQSPTLWNLIEQRAEASESVALPMNYVRPCESWLGQFIRSAAWRT